MFRSKLLILHKFLKAGAHWGYRNAFSQFQPYLYGFRNDIAIINSDKTIICLRRACNVIELIIRAKGHLILVNTNAEYNNIVEHTAQLTGQSFINHKWIGGLLTNWNHIHNVQRHFTQFGADLRAQGANAMSRVSTISNRSVASNRVERTKFAACLANQDDQKGHEPKLMLERSEIVVSRSDIDGYHEAIRRPSEGRQAPLGAPSTAGRHRMLPRALRSKGERSSSLRSAEGFEASTARCVDTAHVHAHSAESFGNSGPFQSRRQALGSLTSIEQPLYPLSVSRVKPSLASQDKCLTSHQEDPSLKGGAKCLPSLDRDGRTNLSVESSARFKKMQKCFAGIQATKLPDCVIILNANSNYNAICEAKLLKIPIIACVDSNVSNQLQNMITYPIPVNSESVHFIYLLCNCIYKTILYARKSTTALSVQ